MQLTMKRNDIYSSDDDSESGDVSNDIGEIQNRDFLPTMKDEVGIPYANDIPQRQETTRAKLANFLILTFAITIGASFMLVVALIVVSVFIDEKNINSFDKTSALAKDLIALILASEAGLIGTVLGFYFGSIK
jgi:hypothetical protein